MTNAPHDPAPLTADQCFGIASDLVSLADNATDNGVSATDYLERAQLIIDALDDMDDDAARMYANGAVFWLLHDSTILVHPSTGCIVEIRRDDSFSEWDRDGKLIGWGELNGIIDANTMSQDLIVDDGYEYSYEALPMALVLTRTPEGA